MRGSPDFNDVCCNLLPMFMFIEIVYAYGNVLLRRIAVANGGDANCTVLGSKLYVAEFLLTK